MHTAALSLIDTLVQRLKQGDVVYLLTLVETYGSSPRPPGSLALITQGGSIYGSVSSGCIESELMDQLLEGGQTFPFITRFGLSEQDNARLGLPCGGTVDIAVERLVEADLAAYTLLYEALMQGQRWLKTLCLNSGQYELSLASNEKGFYRDEQSMRQLFGAQFALVLVGAGALAKHLAQFALAFDYRVIVCDPRQQRLDDMQLAEQAGVTLHQGMPDDLIRDLALSHSLSDMALITLSHDPRIDDMALMEALLQPFFFVGALGSMRTTKQRHKRLLELGVSQAQLQALHAPVGLSIGSKTPPEIAVSILAQLTQLLRQK